MLAVELLFSFYFGVYNGAMVAALSEIVALSRAGDRLLAGVQPRRALFGTFTPLASTFLIVRPATRRRPDSG